MMKHVSVREFRSVRTQTEAADREYGYQVIVNCCWTQSNDFSIFDYDYHTQKRFIRQ